MDFEDGSRRERYETLILEGAAPADDLSFLRLKDWEMDSAKPPKNIEDQLRILVQNQDAKIRSMCDGVINVRARCVGIEAIN